jgi:hypothetical protein
MQGTRRRLRVFIAPVILCLWGATGCSSSPSFEPAAHQPYPQVPTGGGPTLKSPPVDGLVDWLAQSDWIADTSGEYGVQSLGHAPPVTLPGTAPATIADDAIASLLIAQVAGGTVPTTASSTAPYIYLLLFPAGTDVTHDGNDACAANPGDGFHDVVLDGANQLPIVVLPTCDPRFGAILTDIAVMELDAARLLVDTVTDPWIHSEPAFALTDVTNPWASFGHEVGDLCWGRFVDDGPGYTLQRVWSDRAAATGGDACIPAAMDVAFGVSASPSGLPSLQVGVPMSFTVSGWSDAPVPGWTVQATPWVGDYAIEASLDRTTMNNGQTGTLTVTVPYAVPSGTYGAVRIESLTSSDTPSWPIAFTVR